MSCTGIYAKPVYSPFLGPSEPGQSPEGSSARNLGRGAADPLHALRCEALGVQTVSHVTLQVRPGRPCSN